MTNDERSPGDEGSQRGNMSDDGKDAFGFRVSSLPRHSSFVIRHSDSPDARILTVLRTSLAHIARSELATQLGMTPQELTAHIAGLRSAGYDIEEHPHFGYRLVAAPDRIIADDLAGMLDGVALARKILVFEKTDSTNNIAARLGHDGEAEGVAIFAEEQTAGRGRLGRRWESDARQGLWFSLLLRPRFSHALWTRLTTWAAVAIAEAIEGETACRTMIKWPNDVYIDGKKIVGILIESHFDKSQEGFAVLGIGVNVNQENFPPELAGRAASLRMASGAVFDRQKIAAAILRRLDVLYGGLEEGFSDIVAQAWSCGFLNGKWIQVTSGENLMEGTVERLDEYGALVLRLADGSESTISSGEVTLALR